MTVVIGTGKTTFCEAQSFGKLRDHLTAYVGASQRRFPLAHIRGIAGTPNDMFDHDTLDAVVNTTCPYSPDEVFAAITHDVCNVRAPQYLYDTTLPYQPTMIVFIDDIATVGERIVSGFLESTGHKCAKYRVYVVLCVEDDEQLKRLGLLDDRYSYSVIRLNETCREHYMRVVTPHFPNKYREIAVGSVSREDDGFGVQLFQPSIPKVYYHEPDDTFYMLHTGIDLTWQSRIEWSTEVLPRMRPFPMERYQRHYIYNSSAIPVGQRDKGWSSVGEYTLSAVFDEGRQLLTAMNVHDVPGTLDALYRKVVRAWYADNYEDERYQRKATEFIVCNAGVYRTLMAALEPLQPSEKYRVLTKRNLESPVSDKGFEPSLVSQLLEANIGTSKPAVNTYIDAEYCIASRLRHLVLELVNK